jgi:hypothetical protein
LLEILVEVMRSFFRKADVPENEIEEITGKIQKRRKINMFEVAEGYQLVKRDKLQSLQNIAEQSQQTIERERQARQTAEQRIKALEEQISKFSIS